MTMRIAIMLAVVAGAYDTGLGQISSNETLTIVVDGYADEHFFPCVGHKIGAFRDVKPAGWRTVGRVASFEVCLAFGRVSSHYANYVDRYWVPFPRKCGQNKAK